MSLDPLHDMDEDAIVLSALMDGELDRGAALGQCVRALRSDPAARETWMTYHLIGDVLRSADLAQRPGDALVLRVRQALAQEPVVLAPQSPPIAAVPIRPSRWRAPAAALAGVALVAGVWVLVGPREPGAGSVPLAALAPADAVVTLPVPQAAGPALVRDAQLDRYLSAHQEFAGATAIGSSTGFLRASSREPGSR